MNFLMLRGIFPKDRKNPKEIIYNSLDEETDMYTHLWYNVLDNWDHGTVLYYGFDHQSRYLSNFEVTFVKDIKKYSTPYIPDVIFARGNFQEYNDLFARWPMAIRIYYGAGKNFIPPHRNYDLTLVDSEQQARKIKKGMHIQTELFLKPAAPHFRPISCEKQYDVCFVAIHPNDRRKRVQWVYDTVDKNIKVLQIGNVPKKHPKNVTVIHAKHEQMPELINMCRVGIVPSTSEDSGPRVVPEYIACGLPVVVSTDVHIYEYAYMPYKATLKNFWDVVRNVKNEISKVSPISCKQAGVRLRKQIEESR